MTRDDIYRTPRHPLQPFEFNAAVAEVFDDMMDNLKRGDTAPP